jgi:hypothetical protein
VKVFAVTVSNEKILTIRALDEFKARAKAEAAIAERGLDLRVTSVRMITGRR